MATVIKKLKDGMPNPFCPVFSIERWNKTIGADICLAIGKTREEIDNEFNDVYERHRINPGKFWSDKLDQASNRLETQQRLFPETKPKVYTVKTGEGDMPIQSCSSGGKPGYKYGDSGKCYTYTKGNESSRRAAKKKAVLQGVAVKKNQKRVEKDY